MSSIRRCACGSKRPAACTVAHARGQAHSSLPSQIERGEEQILELKQETEKYRGQDKGAASQRKRLIRDLQDRAAEVESKTLQYEEAYRVLTSSIAAIANSIEGLSTKLRCHTQLLTEMGADSGCNESNIMIYLGIVEQRANELLSSYLSLQQHGHVQGDLTRSASTPPSSILIGPNTPAGMSTVSIAVPTTAEDFESDDSEEVLSQIIALVHFVCTNAHAHHCELYRFSPPVPAPVPVPLQDDEHPLSRDELHAKTMRGLAKREASTARKGKAGGVRKR